MASEGGRQSRVLSAAIVGLCLVVGLALAGYFVSRAGTLFRSGNRVVTVKGLVEREVKADKAVWTLGLRRASETLQESHARISADRSAVVDFLKTQGFADAEIEQQPTRTVDKLARDYQPQGGDRLRYVVTTSVVVRTPNVDRVRAALGSTEELLKAGVVLDGEREGGGANPRYVVSTFNDLRPQLLAEATRNARATAQQFAADAGAQVGNIRSAHQGSIQIFGIDGGDESAPFSPTSSPVKRIRVVSTFEFELR
jgi:uncharacterized protein